MLHSQIDIILLIVVVGMVVVGDGVVVAIV
jgi:hypothetical protein